MSFPFTLAKIIFDERVILFPVIMLHAQKPLLVVGCIYRYAPGGFILDASQWSTLMENRDGNAAEA